MIEAARLRGFPRGGHLFFGAGHLGIWGLLLIVAVIILLVVLNNRRR